MTNEAALIIARELAHPEGLRVIPTEGVIVLAALVHNNKILKGWFTYKDNSYRASRVDGAKQAAVAILIKGDMTEEVTRSRIQQGIVTLKEGIIVRSAPK